MVRVRSSIVRVERELWLVILLVLKLQSCNKLNVRTERTESMFAKVVFKDNEEGVVPVDYIKDFDAQKVVPGDECPVFWSLKGKLTPKDVLKKQGVIHRIDQLKKQTDKHGNPLPGYYDAEIKMLAGKLHLLYYF